MNAISQPHDHKSLYRQLMCGLYDALLVTDPNGHLIELNPRATEYFQCSIDETADQPISLLIPGITPKMIGRIHQGLNDARHILLDARCVRKDKSSFAAEVTISVIDLMNVGDLVFTVRNIEPRRKQWELLRSKTNAFMAAQSACFVCGPDRQFKAVNRAFLDMFDFSQEADVLGKSFDDLMSDDPLPEFFTRALDGETLTYRVVAETDEGECGSEIEIQMMPDRQSKDRILGVVGSILQV